MSLSSQFGSGQCPQIQVPRLPDQARGRPQGTSSRDRPQGLKLSFWDSCLGRPGALSPQGLGPRPSPPACSAPSALGSPHSCPPFSELRDTGSARAARVQHFLFSQQRVVCLSHGIISECEPALHLHFILARPQSVHLCRTRFCSRGSREYLTAGPAPSAWERQAPHEAELGGSCRCWLSIPAPPRLVVPILLAFLRAGCGCSSFGRHIRAPCEG